MWYNKRQKGGECALKITIKEPPEGAEEEIVVLCRNISPELLSMLNALKAPSNTIVASLGGALHKLSFSDILYIETVDKKTFLYGENATYEAKQRLFELEALAPRDFLRISKSTIINLNKVKTLIPTLSGNAEAVLNNNERVAISRRYVSNLKKSL